MATPNFIIGSVYSFDTYAQQLLSTNFKNVTILAIMDCDTATASGADTVSLHANIYPYLPPGTINDRRKYNYVKVKTTTGQVTFLGIPWINEATVVLVESKTITVTIPNVNVNDVSKIRNALSVNGFNNFQIDIS